MTYVVPAALRDDVDRAFAAAAASLTAARGEPWLTFFHPAEFEALVRTSGFTSVEHVGPDEAVAQPYFHNPMDRLRPQGLERCVVVMFAFRTSRARRWAADNNQGRTRRPVRPAGQVWAEQRRAGDGFQRPLRSRRPPRLKRDVGMICMATACVSVVQIIRRYELHSGQIIGSRCHVNLERTI